MSRKCEFTNTSNYCSPVHLTTFCSTCPVPFLLLRNPRRTTRVRVCSQRLLVSDVLSAFTSLRLKLHFGKGQDYTTVNLILPPFSLKSASDSENVRLEMSFKKVNNGVEHLFVTFKGSRFRVWTRFVWLIFCQSF